MNNSEVREKRSPLLDLPAELRNRIYEEALIKEGRVRVSRQVSPNDRWLPPSLLHTCKAIRNEASPVYYERNTFIGIFHRLFHPDRSDKDGFPDLATWLTVLGGPTQLMFHKIHLDDRHYAPPWAFTRIRSCHADLTMSGVAIKQEALFVELEGDGGSPWVNLPWLLEHHGNDDPELHSS